MIDFIVANPFRQRIHGTPDFRGNGLRDSPQRRVFIAVLLHQTYRTLTHFGEKFHLICLSLYLLKV